MKSVSVSVIVPCYNCGNEASKAIESVLNQSMQDFEILLINDGSTDDTEDHLKALAETDERIQFFTQKNMGPAGARNHGCRVAQGEWVAFLDHDDTWESEKLAMQLAAARKHKADIVFTTVQNIDPTDRVAEARIAPSVQDSQETVYQELLHENFITLSSALVRLELLKQVGLFTESWCGVEDWALWLKLAEQGSRFYGIDESLVNYYWMESSLSKQHDSMQEQRQALVAESLATSAGQRLGLIERQKIKSSERQCSAWFAAGSSSTSSARMYYQAVIAWPFQVNAWKGLVKSLLRH